MQSGATQEILIVTRDPDAATVYGFWFRHLGYGVRAVADPDEALAVARAIGPDLVVTNFPTLLADGTTLTAGVRATPALSDVPVLNVTSHAMPEELAAGFAAGTNAAVVMPVSLQVLADEVRQLIGPASAQR